mgnify:CR=1 FL=1
MLDKKTRKLLKMLAKRVREARTERGETARELAERAGLSLRFYSQLEAGEANIAIGRLAGVADALQLTLSELLAESAEPAPRAIALVGLRGSGKSMVGPLLAAHFGMEFVELDRRVDVAHCNRHLIEEHLEERLQIPLPISLQLLDLRHGVAVPT